MKKITVILLITCAINTGAFGQNKKISDAVIKAFDEAGIQAASEGIDPVDFTITMLDGTSVNLAQLKGKVVLINFWATWCGPCRSEMPSMEAVYKKFKNKGLEIIAINLGDPKKDVAAFMKNNKLNFPAGADEKSLTGTYYHVQAIPTTYIIDRRGLIVARLVGATNWNSSKMITALETVLQN